MASLQPLSAVAPSCDACRHAPSYAQEAARFAAPPAAALDPTRLPHLCWLAAAAGSAAATLLEGLKDSTLRSALGSSACFRLASSCSILFGPAMALAHAAAQHARGLPPKRQRRAALGLERLMERMLPAVDAVLVFVSTSAEPELQCVLRRTLLRPELACAFAQQAVEVLQFLDTAATGAHSLTPCAGSDKGMLSSFRAARRLPRTHLHKGCHLDSLCTHPYSTFPT